MIYPRLRDVRPLENYRLLLFYEENETRIFDVSPYIKGDWYGMLKDLEYFNCVRVTGKTVSWEDGQDLAPHELYENSILEQNYKKDLFLYGEEEKELHEMLNSNDFITSEEMLVKIKALPSN